MIKLLLLLIELIIKLSGHAYDFSTVQGYYTKRLRHIGPILYSMFIMQSAADIVGNTGWRRYNLPTDMEVF